MSLHYLSMLPNPHRNTLLTLSAHATKSPIRITNVQSPNPRHCTSFQYRRNALPYRVSSKHSRPADHESPTHLGSLVLHRHSRRHNFHPPNLDPSPPNFPPQPWNNNRPHPPHQRSFLRRAMVHLPRYTRHYHPLVCKPSAGVVVRRYGYCGDHSHRSFLRNRHPYERRFQQLPLDHHHPRRRRSCTRESSKLFWSTPHDRQSNHE